MQGFTILISQRFGAEDRQGLRKAVTMSVFLSGITIVVFTTLALLIARPILVWMNTPAETIDMAHLYISIIFAGFRSSSRIICWLQFCARWETAARRLSPW